MSSRENEADRGPQLGSLLRLASQAMIERFAAWIEASKFTGIQPAHSAAIQPLWGMPEGARITTLARAARITKQSMSALVAELESAGYVERFEDPDDARAARVRLTTQGRAYGRAVRAFSRQVEAEWAETIGVQRIADLCTTLELVRTKVLTAADE